VPPSVLVGPDGWPGRDRLTRVQETALGDLFTDAAVWYFRKNHDPTIDFAVLNGSFIEGSIQPGPITVFKMIGITTGTADAALFISIKGDKLKLLFADIADVVHTGRGSAGTGAFGMVSKEVNYTIQYPRAPEGTVELPSEQREPYYHGRIREGTLKIHGQPVDDNQTYRILTTTHFLNSFLTLYEYGFDKVVLDYPFYYAVEEYIYDKVYITPYLDGRIKLEGGVPLPPPWTPGDWVLE
jgi:2',3'-cyclic-nucleotide 2'-phosphodiesterase (5'-nucleotidase family)